MSLPLLDRAIRGNPDHPVNRGLLCPTGLSEHEAIDVDGRATTPLLKRHGRFGAVSWDTALTTMVEKSKDVQRSGAAPFSITGQFNAMGAREAGFYSCLPGRDELRGHRGRRRHSVALSGGCRRPVWRTVEHWHTRTKTGKVPILDHLSPAAWVEMNPRDARVLGLTPRQAVDVVSQRGRVRGVELRLTETVAPGQVFVPFHFAEANANQVTHSSCDPISREPNYKQSAVRIERTDTESRRTVR